MPDAVHCQRLIGESNCLLGVRRCSAEESGKGGDAKRQDSYCVGISSEVKVPREGDRILLGTDAVQDP